MALLRTGVTYRVGSATCWASTKQYDPVQDAQQRREVRAAHLTQAQEAIAAKKGLTTLSAKQKLADGQV